VGAHLGRARLTPDQQLVVGRHGEVGHELQARRLCQHIHRLEVPQSALRVTLAQHRIESRIAVGRELPAVLERPVDGEHPAWFEQARQARQESLHGRPRHDVQRVRSEHCIGPQVRPGLLQHVEFDG
jgi:hypothetical protein